MADNEISDWIMRLKEGDSRATEVIWQHYFQDLVRLARRRLGDIPKRAVDEEDVALSALNSLIRGAELGRFPKLDDDDDLWKLLFTITARKAMKHQRRHFAQKRGGGRVLGESALIGPDDDAAWGIDQVLGHEPSNEIADQLTHSCAEMISMLGDETLEQIALLKLEGFSNAEIAEKLDCAHRSVQRKLGRIRAHWSSIL